MTAMLQDPSDLTIRARSARERSAIHIGPPVRARNGAGNHRGPRPFLPGWPVTFAFAGFPVWWVLGISNFIGHIAAAFLVLELLHRKRIRVPRSFGFWLLFLVWVAIGVLLLQVAAPYAVPSTSTGRYITWLYRFGWYVSATVFLVYIGNMRDQLSIQRVARALSAFFVAIVVGGWLAILTPGLEFPSLLELILPSSINNIEFVNFLIHPTVVQDYAASAAGHPRPSAPFAYANFWGLNFACALPFFLLVWLGPEASWQRRAAGMLIALLAVVPAILSWNRGLWLAVLAMVTLLAVRSALRGQLKTLVGLVSATVIVGMIILLSPLGGMIQSRLENPTSNNTRSNLATLTTISVLEGSPIVGFGSTRDSASSFYSIAGGDRPSCPECSPPALGTQGQLWLALYAQGVLGLIFFLGFILTWFGRGLRMRSPASTAAICVLVAHLVTLPIYDSLGIGTVLLLVAIALLWREHEEPRYEEPVAGGMYTLGGYIRLVRQNAGWISAWSFLGALGAVLLQFSLGNPVIATTSILVSAESPSDAPGFSTSLDTVNQFARSERVRSAMEGATGGPVDMDHLYVSATPNSRILNLRFKGHDAGSAIAGVTSAADAILASRSEFLEGERKAIVERLDAEYATLLRSVATVDASLAEIGERAEIGDWTDASVLNQTRARILSASADVANESARVGSVSFDVGHVVRPATARVTYDPLLVKTVSGLMLGLLVGLLTARVRDVRGRPVAKVHDLSSALDVSVLARTDESVVRGALSAGHPSRTQGLDRWHAIAELMQHSRVVAVMPGDDNQLTRRFASQLDADLSRPNAVTGTSTGTPMVDPTTSQHIVVVVSEAARFGSLAWRITRWRRSGLAVFGLVMIESSDGSGASRAPFWARDIR